MSLGGRLLRRTPARPRRTPRACGGLAFGTILLGLACGSPPGSEDAADGETAPDAVPDAIDGDGTGDAGDPDAPFPGTTLWAAPDGSGTACTAADPCSLRGARDAVRTLNDHQTGDLRVCLREGVYELSETLELDGAEDSASNGFAIRWARCGAGEAVLSGGVRLTGWTVVDAGRNLWRAPVPAGLSFRQLWVDGLRATRARGPWNPPGFVDGASGYTAPDETLASWRRPADLEIVGLKEWRMFRCGVAAVAGRELAVDAPCWAAARCPVLTGYNLGPPAWLENAYELLGTPGQFYLDDGERFVYYVPRPHENLETAEVIAPRLETLVRGVGTADTPLAGLQFGELAFRHTGWLQPDAPAGYVSWQAGFRIAECPAAGMEPAWLPTPAAAGFAFVHDLVIERCVFERLGGAALAIERGAQDNRVEGNLFRDLSSGAIRLGGTDGRTADAARVTRGNLLRNNLISDAGLEYFDVPGIGVGYARDTAIEHNVLERLPYTGISIGWGWTDAETVLGGNRTAFNRIGPVMRRLRDGGGIYTLSRQDGSSIEGNWLRGAINLFGGLYLDNGTAGYAVTGNVTTSLPNWFVMQCDIPPAASGNSLRLNWSDTRDDHCAGLLGRCTDPAFGNTVADNVFFDPGLPPAEARAVMEASGLEPDWAQLQGLQRPTEAEDYAGTGDPAGSRRRAGHDLTPGNAGGHYRTDDVDVFADWGCSNGAYVGDTQTGEWLTYDFVTERAGTVRLEFVLAGEDPAAAAAVEVDGVTAGSVAPPDRSGAWGAAELAVPVAEPGWHRLTLYFTGSLRFDSWSAFAG